MNIPPTTTEAPESVPPEQVRRRLWTALVDIDEDEATASVLDALDAGMSPETALLEVVAPIQRQVGSEWAANRFSVAQEHAATALNDRVVAAVAHHPASGATPTRGRVAVACVDGEWHALPARLLAEVLRLRGWRVDFLGAQVPTPHLIAHLHQQNPEAVALSSSIPTRLPTAHAAITACQAVGIPVLAGGPAFGSDGRYATLLGADAWAADAVGAATLLADGVPRPDPTKGRQPIDDLPHLADQEYTMVAQSAPMLVNHVLAGLQSRYPSVAEYTDIQRQHTIEDLGHIVDFLAVSLYTDDDSLFTGFVTWTADVLAARHVPPVSLQPTLDLLIEKLTEFPRATRLLTAARAALDTHLIAPLPTPGPA